MLFHKIKFTIKKNFFRCSFTIKVNSVVLIQLNKQGNAMLSSLRPSAFPRLPFLHIGSSHTVEVKRELNTWVKSAVETCSVVFLASRTFQQLSNSTLYLALFLLVLLALELTTASTMCNSSPWGRKCTARPFLPFLVLLLHLILLVLLRLVRFMPQPASFILHSRPTWNDMQPEALGSSSCKASTVMERSTLVLTVLLTFGATYFSTAYTVYIDFFFWSTPTWSRYGLLEIDYTLFVGQLSFGDLYCIVLYCNAEWKGEVFAQRLVPEAQFKTSKHSQILYKYSVKCYLN